MLQHPQPHQMSPFLSVMVAMVLPATLPVLSCLGPSSWGRSRAFRMIPAPPPLLAVCSEEMELGADQASCKEQRLPASLGAACPSQPWPPGVTLLSANPLGLVSSHPAGASLEAAQTLVPEGQCLGQHRPISRIASRLLPSSSFL